MADFATNVSFFEQRIAERGDCWEWTGARHYSKKGGGPYGRARPGGKAEMQYYAHRLSWEIHRGYIPEGLTIDHLCRNTLCVNPDHLEPVPSRVNSRRNVAHYREMNPTCQWGHSDWSYRTGPRQGRYCAECNRIRVRNNKRKKNC